MSKATRRFSGSVVSAVCLAWIIAAAARAGGPDGPWRQYASASQAGWSEAKLAEARALAEQINSAAVMAVHRGHVVLAWGDVQRPFKCHSVRKSFMSALYGPYVEDGTIDLTTTLADLGIDDREGLTDAEKRATIADLLASRSGIYHHAAKETDGHRDTRPERGSHAPGTHFWYNNWDFNIAGVIFEQLTGKTIFEEFERRIAGPLGMEDFSLADMAYELEPMHSIHTAYAFRMSARDAARFGWLYAENGRWNGRTVVPESWVKDSTTLLSDLGDGHGYGFMWWIYPAGGWGDDTERPVLNRYHKFAASGTGGQFILVVPEAEFVFVHRGDTDNGREVGGGPIWQMAEMILAAYGGAGEPKPALTDLKAEPFADALPAPPRKKAVAVDPSKLEQFVGVYEIRPGVQITMEVHQDRLFGAMTGEGAGEFLAESETTYFLATRHDITIEFKRDESGTVNAVVLTMAGRQMTGRKIR